ncbi:hypothetical protein PENTCL1PPCAC_5348, partial [Pristionchus entomophagus]
MVYSDDLGYDPDEWEECPPPDHFLVFSPFTRLVLSLTAIGFCALFFSLVGQNKSKGKKEEEEKEKVTRIAPSSSSPASGDSFLSTLGGLLTGNGRAVDTDFVQRSFRDEERSPAAAAAAVRDTDSKVPSRADELSSSFHYKRPEEGPKSPADVRAELDQAAFELRDLLGDQSTAPPVPPHRSPTNDLTAPFSAIVESLSGVARQAQDGVADVYDRVGQTAHDAYDRVAAPVAFDQAGRAAHDAAQRAGEYLGEMSPPTLSGTSDRVHDAHDQAVQQAANAYDRAAVPVADAFNRSEQAAHDTYERASAQAADAYERARQAADDAYGRGVAALVADAGQQAAVAASDAYDRATARFIDPETSRLEDDFERVQRDLDNLMAEHQVPLGVIIPGSSPTSPAASSSRPQHLQQQSPATAALLQDYDTMPQSPIDEHVRQLTAGLLSSEGDQERKPSDIPSLHDIYEERQRQMSPPMASPVKIPTMEDRAALQHWEEELARKEQEKLSKLVDTIVGGDDISDIAASEGTEHLLPADRISMYSQDSATVHHIQQQENAPLRRGDENEPLPASDKINQKIDQISSALEQSLLSEIEQLARQTSTMQAELARARDSEYSADEVSDGPHHDPRLDAFQPAGDVRFIPAGERADQPGQISHRNSERQSGESDDFVKITPPSHSGAPSPSPLPVGMSSSEEEQLKRLVEEYDVIGSTSTLKKDASAPGALDTRVAPAAPHAASAAQQQQPLPSPTTAALLQEYETVQQPQQQPFQAQPQVAAQQQHSPPSAYADSPLAAAAGATAAAAAQPRISAEEQAQLDQVLRDFERTPETGRKDVLNRPDPRTPPQTPEPGTLMDPFG